MAESSHLSSYSAVAFGLSRTVLDRPVPENTGDIRPRRVSSASVVSARVFVPLQPNIEFPQSRPAVTWTFPQAPKLHLEVSRQASVALYNLTWTSGFGTRFTVGPTSSVVAPQLVALQQIKYSLSNASIELQGEASFAASGLDYGARLCLFSIEESVGVCIGSRRARVEESRGDTRLHYLSLEYPL